MRNPKRDRSLSLGAATIYTLLVVSPLMALLVLLYSAVWGIDNFFGGLYQFMAGSSLIPAILVGVPAHEGIHGLTWLWIGKVSLKDIRFGLKFLTPYTLCEVPIRAKAYRAGAIMPALILGFVPYLISLVIGNGWFTAFGLLYIFAAGGDLVVLWILRGVDGDAWVEDHPSRAGCYVIEERSRNAEG